VTGAITVRRGRIPDKARYKSGGVYVQDTYEVVSNLVKLVGNLRWSGASYVSKASDSPIVNGQPLWPDDSATASALAFRAGAVVTPSERWSISGNISRGFRAPHVTDLGTLGLTGSGYQVSATAVEGMGATVGSTAGANAVSTGQPVEQVKPETSLSYEAGLHYRDKRFSTDLSMFVNDVYDNIAYQALILPPGAVGTQLGDQTITSQNANGVVWVPAASNPVLVRTNFGDARIWGIEHTFDWRATANWSAGTVFTYLHAEDKATGEPPNIEGGTPAPELYLKVRYVAPGGRFWVVPYIHFAADQGRLSTLDLEDRRTGATRTRTNIKNFFYNGAAARGWVSAGPDGVFGNADDVLIKTGETLSQVQNRVLGVGVDGAPLYTKVKGYVTVNVRGGFRIKSRHEITFDLENLGDVNYRGIAWGIDAYGRSVSVAYQLRY
jgi:hemoglobin/transferrin/lactoferrin receptor protein